jgi:hypothetical protein
MRTLTCVLFGVILLGVAGCGGSGEVRPVPPAFQDGFSGTWVRNAALSQNPQEAAGEGDAFGGGGRGVGRGGGRGGGRGRAGGNDFDPAEMQRLMQLMGPAERLILTVTDATVETRTGRGAPLILNLDGEEVETDLGNDLTMKTKAEWRDETLELRNDFGMGFWIERSYSLDAETGHLLIEVSSRVRGQRVRTRQVYDRADR